MSIYGTGFHIQIEDDSRGGWLADAWIEVYGQFVPNHINEQNGYGGPGWDEWLPAFVHKPGCTQHNSPYYNRAVAGEPGWLREYCDADDEGAERRDYYECDCGPRAVFICDDLTKKATDRNGQEYVNPVLVLTGAEYEAITWDEMLRRIESSVAERHGKPLCMEPGCTGEAVHYVIGRRGISGALCEQHDTPKLRRGQERRRKAAAALEATTP